MPHIPSFGYMTSENHMSRRAEQISVTDLLCLIYLPLPHLWKHGCGPHPHLTRTDVAYDGRRRWLHVCAASLFFFFFFICGFAPIQVKFTSNRADSRQFGPNRMVSANDRNWLKSALNQVEILVKIKIKINYAKLTILNFEALCLLPLSLSHSLSPLSHSLTHGHSLRSQNLSFASLPKLTLHLSVSISSSLGLNLSIMECFSFKLVGYILIYEYHILVIIYYYS